MCFKIFYSLYKSIPNVSFKNILFKGWDFKCTFHCCTHIYRYKISLCMGENRDVYSVFMGKPEGKRPLGRPRRRWKDNINMDLQEVGCGGVDWIELVQGRDSSRAVVNTVINIWLP